MKTRNGFVSNSSSSSFIIHNGNIYTVASSMLKTVMSDWEDSLSKKNIDLWKKNLKIAAKREDVQTGEIGIIMPSCNYETYIFKPQNNSDIYVSTSNNHDWNFEEIGIATFKGSGADYGNSDEVHVRVDELFYFNIKNCLLHSSMRWNNSVHKSSNACPNCNEYYGHYVIYKGKNLCSSCYKGVIGTKEILNPTQETYIDEEKVYKDIVIERIKNIHPIKFLEP